MGLQMLPQFIYWIIYMFIYNSHRECPFPFFGPHALQIIQASEDE